MRPVDVIIPVYNAYDFTKICIEKVIAYTDLSLHTLVVINDKSTDERIVPMLQDFVNIYSGKINLKFINCKENHGFVKTVNLGMHNSDNDVVLLNSDTEVTPRWLDKMVACAYSKPMVATVTPLSNNATLASVPVYLKENVLPNGFLLDEYANQIEDCSKKLYPELCTAHGFCMFIKREAINTIGFFDDVTFGKGYGEENDFSYRCMQYGYRHLLADDTFIYHKGTQSFSQEGAAKAADHLKILYSKYPKQTHNTDLFVRDNPLTYIQENIQLNVINKKRKSILYVIHDFKNRSERNIGGTTLHLYDLIDNLRQIFNIHVLYYNERTGLYYLRSFYDAGEKELTLRSFERMSDNHFYNIAFAELTSEILSVFHIDIIHIHHLKNMYLDIFDVAEKLCIPVLFTFHDFHTICPTITLLDDKDQLCSGKHSEYCATCLKKMIGSPYDYINIWREELYIKLKNSKRLFAPSTTAKNIVNSIYPELNVQVIEHGYEVTKETIKIENDEKAFNVAFVGGIYKAKGLDHLISLIKMLKGTNINIHMFGDTSCELINQNLPNYYFHGQYDREELPTLLHKNKVQLVLFLSICAETFSYTLSESIAAKIPALALDIGAIGERIKRNDIGYLLPAESTSEEIFDMIDSISKDDETYNLKVKNLYNALNLVKSIKEMSDEYKDIYNFVIKNQNYADRSDMDFSPALYRSLFQKVVFVKESAKDFNISDKVDEFKQIKNLIKSQVPYKIAYAATKEYIKNHKEERYKIYKKFFWYRILNFRPRI